MPITLEQFRKITTENIIVPDWVVSETTKKLYTSMTTTYTQIKLDIDKGLKIRLNDRQIVARRLAIQCKLSPSIITERRQPGIVNLLRELNTDLALHYKSALAKTWTSGRKLTKDELIRENKNLKAEIAELRKLKLGAYATAILESNIPVEARSYTITISKLKEEIARQETVISNQAEQNRKYMEALNQKNDM